MANFEYNYGFQFRQGRCRRLVEALETTTNRPLVVAIYNNDGLLEGTKEVDILRRLAASEFVVDLFDHKVETEPENYGDPNAPAVWVYYEHLQTDLSLYRNALPNRRLPAAQLKSVFYQITRGIAAVHGSRIFLRDLRPEKIRISEDPLRAKLSDFLGAKVPHDFAPATDLVTPPSMLERDLRYQAPEQLIGSQMIKPAVDIWALGAIIAEGATGEVLFQVNPASEPRTHLQYIYGLLGTPEENPYPPDVEDHWAKQRKCQSSVNLNALLLPHLGPIGTALVIRMLCFNPERRITAQELLESDYFRHYVME